MGYLDAYLLALAVCKLDNPCQRFNMLVGPKAYVFWGDTSFGKDGGSLYKCQPGSPHQNSADWDESVSRAFRKVNETYDVPSATVGETHLLQNRCTWARPCRWNQKIEFSGAGLNAVTYEDPVLQFKPTDSQRLEELRDRFSVRLRDYGRPGGGILDWGEERNIGCGDVDVIRRHQSDDESRAVVVFVPSRESPSGIS